MSGLPYNERDIVSIFDYSKHLIDKCLRDFVPDAGEYRGKGGLGQLVEEHYFKYGVNSRQEADFAFVNAELKCTPLKRAADGELLIKERLVCSMINYAEDWNKSFEESHFYKKCLMMLILFYLHGKNTPKLDLKFIFSVLWRIQDKDLLIIRNDYETIISKIRDGKAHDLSEGDTMYLGACRKGQKGDSLMAQHDSPVRAPRRAWSLKAAYMRIILDEVKKNNVDGAYSNVGIRASSSGLKPLFTFRELSDSSVDEILLKRFAPYVGKTYEDICRCLGTAPETSKSRYFNIANKIAGNAAVGNVNRTEEFRKSGLTMKTVRVRQTGVVKESMSFENIDYQEVFDCNDWVDSRLYELFTSRFLLVVFRETDQDDKNAGKLYGEEYRLDKVAFWTMPSADLNVARDYWQNIRKCVLENHIDSKHFWSMGDDRYFHVRPKARVADDMTENPNGGMAKKYCYWFNARYVRNIIDNEI